MPKLPSPKDLDRLIELISLHHEGVGIDALLQAIDANISLRTLQRRLSQLIGQGRIHTNGIGRALRYHLAQQIVVADTSIQEKNDVILASAEVYVPLSPEGEQIKDYVRQPRQMRRPVGYKLEFLEQYHPNQSNYLPQHLRDQLHSLGRSPAEQSPAGTFARDILNRLLIDSV